jgi:hypothetical protein
MWLLPSGKKVILETRDGLSQTIEINRIYEPKTTKTKWMKRIDFGHGANNFIFMMGKPIIQDKEVMDAILNCKFIDCKNTAFDFDVSSEFTWDYKELVKIKKQRRRVDRFYTPTAKNLLS